MKVTLREKPISNGRKSLYLDFYPAILHPETGKHTRREFLKMYVFVKPRSEEQKEHNKLTRDIARTVCAKRQIEIQNQNFDFLCKDNSNESFLNFMRQLVDKREESGTNFQTWKSAYLFLYRFSEGHLAFKQVTEKFCKNFKEYLLETNCLKSPKKLKQNSAVAYFNIFKLAVGLAYDEKYFKDNPARRVKSIPAAETSREFLVFEELQAMAKAECEDKILKKAAFFSAFTGLRWGDIKALTWKEVYRPETSDRCLRFTSKKPNRPLTIPINEQVVELIGKKGNPDELVFKGLKYSNNTSLHIRKWALNAGILRNLTFHSFRHTHATLLITEGIDIYVVSKMLGHKKVETTQIYSKVIDKKKQEAANIIPKINF